MMKTKSETELDSKKERGPLLPPPPLLSPHFVRRNVLFHQAHLESNLE